MGMALTFLVAMKFLEEVVAAVMTFSVVGVVIFLLEMMVVF